MVGLRQHRVVVLHVSCVSSDCHLCSPLENITSDFELRDYKLLQAQTNLFFDALFETNHKLCDKSFLPQELLCYDQLWDSKADIDNHGKENQT